MTLKNTLKRTGMAILAVPLVYGIGWLAVNRQNISTPNPKNNLETIAENSIAEETERPKLIIEDKINVKDVEVIAENNNLAGIANETSLISKPNARFEYPNPKYSKDDNFASDTPRMALSRLYYGEASTEIDNPDYLYGVERTLKNRARIKKKVLKNKDIKNENIIKEIILKNNGKVWQYTCFDPKQKDENYEKLKDPIGYGKEELKAYREKVWKKCYDLAGRVLDKDTEPKNKKQEELKTATNYWVDSISAPYWAYIHDKKGNKVLRTPLVIVPVMNGKYKARFYSFKYP